MKRWLVGRLTVSSTPAWLKATVLLSSHARREPLSTLLLLVELLTLLSALAVLKSIMRFMPKQSKPTKADLGLAKSDGTSAAVTHHDLVIHANGTIGREYSLWDQLQRSHTHSASVISLQKYRQSR